MKTFSSIRRKTVEKDLMGVKFFLFDTFIIKFPKSLR